MISSYHASTWSLAGYSAQTGQFSHLLGVLSHGHYTPLPFTGLARQSQASVVW